MLRCVLRYTAEMCLEYVVTVEEGHFAIGFDPDLKYGVKTWVRITKLNDLPYTSHIVQDNPVR